MTDNHVFCLLCACVLLCTAAEGSLRKVLRAERTQSVGDPYVTLTLTYEADTEPDVAWLALNKPVTDTFQHTFVAAEQRGSTTIRVLKMLYGLRVNIGDIPSHYISLHWRYTNDPLNGAMDLNLSPVDVIPSTDLAYRPNEQVEVSFRVTETAEQAFPYQYHTVYTGGDYVNHTTGLIDSTYIKNKAFLKTSTSSGNVTTTKLTFLTDRQVINGYFSGMLEGHESGNKGTPVTGFREMFGVSVHEERYGGPYPTGYVKAQFDHPTSNVQLCTSHDFGCYLQCSAKGNHVTSLTITKMEEDGSVTSVGREREHVRPHSKMLIVILNDMTASKAALIVVAPKNLLRNRRCISSLEDMGPGTTFKRLIPETDSMVSENPDSVKKLVFCSGQIYYELLAEREKREIQDVALVRIEQIAPFAFDRVAEMAAKYKNAEVIWAQQEPKNMGAYSYVNSRIMTATREINGNEKRPRYVGRAVSAAPATGMTLVHQAEYDDIMNGVYGKES